MVNPVHTTFYQWFFPVRLNYMYPQVCNPWLPGPHKVLLEVKFTVENSVESIFSQLCVSLVIRAEVHKVLHQRSTVSTITVRCHIHMYILYTLMHIEHPY